MPANLGSLPLELRIMIYDILFPPPRPSDLAPSSYKYSASSYSRPLASKNRFALLQTCRYIYEECAPLALSRAIIRIPAPLLSTLPREGRVRPRQRMFAEGKNVLASRLRTLGPGMGRAVTSLQIPSSYAELMCDALESGRGTARGAGSVFPGMKRVCVVAESFAGVFPNWDDEREHFAPRMIAAFPALQVLAVIWDLGRSGKPLVMQGVCEWPDIHGNSPSREKLKLWDSLLERLLVPWDVSRERENRRRVRRRSRPYYFGVGRDRLHHWRSMDEETGMGCVGIERAAEAPEDEEWAEDKKVLYDDARHVHILFGSSIWVQMNLANVWTNQCPETRVEDHVIELCKQPWFSSDSEREDGAEVHCQCGCGSEDGEEDSR